MQKQYLLGPMTWKVTRRNVWKDIANLQIKRLNHGQYGRPSRSLERNLYGHPLAGLLRERQFEKVHLKYGWETFPIGNAYSYNVKKDYSYLCMWMTSNWLERSKILIRCGNY